MSELAKYQFIDIHYHASPDLYERRYNAIDAGRLYQSMQGAVVLKSHLGSTSVQATLAQQLGLPVFPSVVLNAIAGGIDYRVILRSLSEYQPVIPSKLIVHFPTITGRAYKSKLPRKESQSHLGNETKASETIFDHTNQLRKEVIDILKLANDYPIVLSTGHASREEVYSLIEACYKYNVHTLLLNQPAHPLVGFQAKDLKALAQNQCIWIEQTALTYLLGHQSKEDFCEVLLTIPRVLYSSDLGQCNQMDVTDWLTESASIFNELSVSEQRKKDLIQVNAFKLLSL